MVLRMSKLVNQTSQDEVRTKYIQRFQEMIRECNDKLSKLENPEEISKLKQNIAGLEKSIECVKSLPIIRDPRVPENILDHNVWNDCWYDEEKQAFVMLNSFFEEVPNARTRNIQIKYDKETNSSNHGIIIEEKRIQFMYGYPVITRQDQDNNPVWHFLPTMKDNMLTKEIVQNRFRPKTHEESVIYETESEAWIEALGAVLSEQEYIFACEVISYLVKTPIEVLKAISGRPYDQKVYRQQMTEISQETK